MSWHCSKCNSQDQGCLKKKGRNAFMPDEGVVSNDLLVI